jgi:hypothetical protein
LSQQHANLPGAWLELLLLLILTLLRAQQTMLCLLHRTARPHEAEVRLMNHEVATLLVFFSLTYHHARRFSFPRRSCQLLTRQQQQQQQHRSQGAPCALVSLRARCLLCLQELRRLLWCCQHWQRCNRQKQRQGSLIACLSAAPGSAPAAAAAAAAA